MILLALVVISSSIGRFITQSRSCWIMVSASSLWYLPGRLLLFRYLWKVFSKLSLVQKSCKIPVEISLVLMHWLSSSEYYKQWTLYCSIPVLDTFGYSITVSTSHLSCETGPGFSSWRCRNKEELLFIYHFTLLTWKLLYMRFRLGSVERSKL